MEQKVRGYSFYELNSQPVVSAEASMKWIQAADGENRHS